MKIELEIPDDLCLRGFLEFEEVRGGRTWRAYVGPRNSLYLQGAVGFTPQEAVDLAVKRVRDNVKAFREYELAPSGALAGITLDLSLLDL